MRLFKSNKSQASIDRLTGSRPGSPTLSGPDAVYPQQVPPQSQIQTHGQPQAQAQQSYGGAQFAHPPHPPPHSDRFGQHSVDDNLYPDPQPPASSAHILARSQSSRASSGGDAYAAHRQSVNIIPQGQGSSTILELQVPGLVSGHTNFGQSRQVHPEKEHKRSKRSIFGLTSSKDKEREKEKENSPTESKRVGRSGSVHLLRKSPQIQVPVDPQPQSPQHQSPEYRPVRQSVYLGGPESSSENLSHDSSSRYEQYRTHPVQYDSPQGQYSHQPPDYEDGPHLSPQREKHQAYHLSGSANTSDPYLPYQNQQGRPAGIILDHHQSLRPPSQSSLGPVPPSPVANSLQHDSRPSTATTNRFSGQSATTQIQQAAPMARGDPPNGTLRQQISQQRETRSVDDHQYQALQDPRVRMSQQPPEQGRSTPREDLNSLDYQQLRERHDELLAKYSKVKRYYFEREAQVTHLQNTVANQRLSMSKTSLDDAQYAARFERLSGAINNLSFNIRKNWRGVPPWLRAVCNQDAHTVGTKEMTAVGRACITRWIFEMIFERFFHPALDNMFSERLKQVERNLRRTGQSSMLLTDEQRDDLTTKVTTWRLTTVEGLQDLLSSRQAEQNVELTTKSLTISLTESLKANLTDPPPPGLSEGVATIIGQAVGIAANLPLESRDVCVEYFMPGTLVNETYMKVESGMTPLTNPGLDERISMQQQSQDDLGDDTASTDGDRDVEADIREAAGKASSGNNNNPSSAANGAQRAESVTGSATSASKSSQDKAHGGGGGSSKKSSFLGGFVSKKPTPQTRHTGGSGSAGAGVAAGEEERPGGGRESTTNISDSGTTGMGSMNASGIIPGGNNEGKIRFAVFLSVEVRGKGGAGGGGAGAKDANAAGGSGGVGSGGGSTGASGAGGSAVNVLCRAPIYEF